MANLIVESCIHFHFISLVKSISHPYLTKKVGQSFFREANLQTKEVVWSTSFQRECSKNSLVVCEVSCKLTCRQVTGHTGKKLVHPTETLNCPCYSPCMPGSTFAQEEMLFSVSVQWPGIAEQKKNPRAVCDEEATWLTPLTRFFDLITWKKWQCKEVQSMDQEQCVLWSFIFPYLA